VASHEILGGLVQVYKRGGSGRFWQCSASFAGRQHRSTTKEEGLTEAKQFAEDWYLELRGKARAGILKKREPTFRQAADLFTEEYEVITQGQRSPKWVQGHQIRLRLHLLPFFGDLGLSEIDAGKAQDYRVYRITGKKPGEEDSPVDPTAPPHKPPARSTLHDEFITLRLVLQAAVRKRWLTQVPDFSPPYKTSGKIVHRPWFSPEEYKQLFKATREHAEQSKGKRWQWDAEQVHDYVLFMANTGLRPDEARPHNLLHRDVTIVKDKATGERILEMEVRGKRGVGYCKSMPSAVLPYERLLKRAKFVPRGRKPRSKKTVLNAPPPPTPMYPEPTDPVFPGDHKKLFNGVLNRTNLKLDRNGHRRTAYSLRHTYICMRLMEGADIYQLAKNCRTSVEMIEKFYAAHIKHMLDAASINVMRSRGQSTTKAPIIRTARKPSRRSRPKGQPDPVHV
jgi:integrase